jgi:cellulose synthase/poly-beta-1,6-N-acetylglucosamine synthase-like glycosyltransferase
VGTNAIYRRRALEPFGGTAAIAYSEDLHTGFQILEAGQKVVYLPINLAKGLCPDNPSSFFIQQYRWATGSTSLFLSRHFWEVKLPLVVRLNYLSGMLYYFATALGIIITPLPGLLMVWLLPTHIFWYNILFSLPSFIYGTFYLAVWTQAPFGWYAFQSRIISYHAHLFAILDKLNNKTVAWVPTGARNVKISRYDTFTRFVFIWSSLVTAGILAGVALQIKSIWNYNFYPMIFFTLYNYGLNLSVLEGQWPFKRNISDAKPMAHPKMQNTEAQRLS